MSLVLRVGKAVSPHPKKLATGSEDASFHHRAGLGVFDGVGGSSGDAARYARTLAYLTCVYSRAQGAAHVATALEFAINRNASDGSSTACVFGVSGSLGRGICVGDSRLLIVRDGRVLMASKVMRHSFNVPFQLSRSCRGTAVQADVFSCRLAVGDVVVLASDGLWDNMYVPAVLDVLVRSRVTSSGQQRRRRRVHRQVVEWRAHVAARELAVQALAASNDRKWKSPFAKEAAAVGRDYRGGKPDDITVLVAYVSDPTKEVLV